MMKGIVSVAIGQTATIAIALGIREVTVALAVTVSLNAPLLAIGASYAITCAIVKVNAA